MSTPRDPREPWPTRGTARVHNGWLQLYRSEVQLPSGEWCRDFYRVVLKPYVMIVPLDAQGRVVMLDAYRHGADAVLTELPGGMIEPGELPQQAAIRELREETGLEAQSWHTIAEGVITDPNHDCGTAYMFVARGLTSVCEPDGSGIVVHLSAREFLEDCRHGVRHTALPTFAAIAAVSHIPWRRAA